FEFGVFGLGGFCLGVCNFMKQGFVGFVGFHGASLVAIFPGAVLPLRDVEVELLALFEVVGKSCFGRSDIGASIGELGVGVADALGEGLQVSAEGGDLLVEGLNVYQMGNGGMHEPLILAQRSGGPWDSDW